MYSFDGKIACSDKIIVAQKSKINNDPAAYRLQHIERPSIPNKALALSIGYSGVPVSQQQINRDVKQYNTYIAFLNSLPGFTVAFAENDFAIKKEQALLLWPKETVAQIFSLKPYYFETPLHVYQDILYDCNYGQTYCVSISGEEIALPVGKDANQYPSVINGKKCIWNWIDNGHDFTFGLWELLGERSYKDEKNIDDENQVSYSHFECYEASRYEFDVEVQFIKIFEKLEKLGYLETFTIKSEAFDPRWKLFGKSDGTIDLALIDESFKKNKLLMEQIELLMWSKPEVLEKPFYFLTNKDNKQYLSDTPGQFGGHRKLKIYGRLDCPSANRYVQQGEYVKHRVFFKDEATATAAGYRPCGICMKERYRQWKKDPFGFK